MKVLCILFALKCTYMPMAFAQQPEINDQFETIPTTTVTAKTRRAIETDLEEKHESKPVTNNIKPLHYLLVNLYAILRLQIRKVMMAPKIRIVFRNVGTCMVNGAMDLISYYLPAPIIPLITSAAGMVIPFEPVMMLKKRIPAASYRRAVIMAVNTFLNTFNNYKFDYDDDPYMTGRFNRRFNKDPAEKPVL